MTRPDPPRWAPVREELARWRDTGHVARLWLRDDDAVAVTPALRQLMVLCESHGVTPLIATIPAHATTPLADYLLDGPRGELAVHGWAHVNHALAGSKSQEFPTHRPRQQILTEIEQAKQRVDALTGSRALPIYVPPWNRIAIEVAELLPAFGFCALSAFGPASIFKGEPPLLELNTHVDIIDWRGTRGARDPDRLVGDVAQALRWSRDNGDLPVGVLTHHLVHDEAAWRFLGELFTVTASHPAVRWCRAGELMGQPQGA